MLGRILLLFVLVPLVELALLIQVGRMIGLWTTVALVFLTGVAGGLLARAQGLRTLARVQGEMARGRVPGRALVDGAAILAGGILLLTPGILTDLVGFALLFPLTRRGIHALVLHRILRAVSRGTVRVDVTDFGRGPSPFGEGPEERGPFPGAGREEAGPAEGPAEEQPYRPGEGERDAGA